MSTRWIYRAIFGVVGAGMAVGAVINAAHGDRGQAFDCAFLSAICAIGWVREGR